MDCNPRHKGLTVNSVTHFVEEGLDLWPRQQARPVLYGGPYEIGCQDNKRQLVPAFFAFDTHAFKVLHTRHSE